MRRREHLKQGLQAWQPKKYRALIAKKYREILGTVGVWLFFSLMVMLIIAIPHFVTFAHSMEEQLSSFETFSIDANVSLRTPITLSTTPLVMINPQQENLSKEKVLINNNGVAIKRSFWQEERIVPWATILDVPTHAATYSRWLQWGFILLLPTVLLVISVLFAIEAALLALLCTALGFLISKLFKFRITFRQLIKVTTLAVIPLMTLQLVPFFYLRWWIVPVVLYALLVFFSSWLVGESKLEQDHH